MSLSEKIILHQVDSHRISLLAYVWLLTSSTSVAEECFQELKRTVVKRKQELKNETMIPSWCRKTARFDILTRFGYTGTAPFPLRDTTLDLIDSAWRDYPNETIPCGPQVLQRWAEDLVPSARRIVMLRYGQKLDGQKVARILNRRASTVYTMLGHIHRRLSLHVRSRGENREAVYA